MIVSHRRGRRQGRLVLFLALLFMPLAACTESPPTNLYMISGLETEAANRSSATSSPVIGVGPITVPSYLDRPQIVRRASANKLVVGEFDRWAEPLKELVSRVLAENLAVILESDTVFTLPRRRLSEVDIQVELEVSRFDAAPDGVVHLTGRWAIYSAGGKNLTAAKKSVIREQAGSDDYEEVTIAMSRALERLSQEIAVELRPLL
ncbi:MAG: PqiC family protein [Kiloniellales bacterium]|nr:PqiC family protein [Kiloniellales bacterium]